ncbi:MAG: GNAT family N-acetyltransferase [Candidatus Thorarchaeota archaeon]
MTSASHITLPDGLEFGTVETDEELEELIKFNSTIHGPEDGEELGRIIENLPGFGRQMNWFVRDVDKGVIVSSLNGIPSTWAYAGIPLRNLELGFVGTLPEYRNKGLIRALYQEIFEREFHRGKYEISTIQGIPYYYRQFGYDFLIPAWRSVFLMPSQVPAIPPKEKPAWMKLTVRRAVKKDLDAIMNLYDEMRSRTLISTVRNRELWEIQERSKREYEREFTTHVVKRGLEIEGYFRLVVRQNKTDPAASYIDVIESSIKTYDGVRRSLEYLRQQCAEKNLPRFALSGALTSNLSKVGMDLRGVLGRGWKHQLRIPDMVRFLKRVRPVLEKRLRKTMFKGFTQEVTINTYRHCYVLDFQGGKIRQVKDLGIHKDGMNMSFRSPPNDFVRLLLGQYDIEELGNHNIDFIVAGPVRSLISTLFPKQESYIGYYYC